MSEHFDDLPEDLHDLARRLSAERDRPDGHLHDRVLARLAPLRSEPSRRPFDLFRRPRVAAFAILAACLGLNVSGAMATALKAAGVSSASANNLTLTSVVSSVTSGSSSSSKSANSAANATYASEKPGCGNEQNIGISGNSGAHGGQPPKQEERGQCPHTPGVDGN